MHVGTIISTSLALGLQVGTAVPGSDSRAPGFYGKHFTDGAVSPRPAVFTEILGLKLSRSHQSVTSLHPTPQMVLGLRWRGRSPTERIPVMCGEPHGRSEGLRWGREQAVAPSLPAVLTAGSSPLTTAAGLDEEQLGLPSQAGAAAPIEDVHNFLNGHGASICPVDSPRELEMAGLQDKAPQLQKTLGRNLEACLSQGFVWRGPHSEGPRWEHSINQDGAGWSACIPRALDSLNYGS